MDSYNSQNSKAFLDSLELNQLKWYVFKLDPDGESMAYCLLPL